MFLVHDANHLLALDFEGRACGNGRSSGHAKAADAGERFLSNEIADREKGDRGLFPVTGNDGKSGAALLEIENGVGGVAL